MTQAGIDPAKIIDVSLWKYEFFVCKFEISLENYSWMCLIFSCMVYVSCSKNRYYVNIN